MAVVPFGSFPGGALSEFTDTGCKGGSPGVSTALSGLAPGKYKGVFSTVPKQPNCYGASDGQQRTHMLGNNAVSAIIQNGQEFWRCISVRQRSGDYGILDEVHHSNPPGNTTSAPFNLYCREGKWSLIVRSSSDISSNNFTQWAFGDNSGSFGSGSTRPSQAWQGLSNAVTTDEWIHFFYGWHMSPSTSLGWYEAWAARGTGQMVNIVPRKTGIGTCYPLNQYPMMSLYYPIGSGGTHTFEYAGGGYAQNTTADIAALKSFQVAEIGYDMWGGATAPPVDPPVENEPVGFMGGRYAILGTSSLGSQVDRQRASRTVVARTGTASGMGVYVEPARLTSVETMRLAVWPDNGFGSDPGTSPPLAISSEITIDSTDASGAYEANFGSPINVTEGQILWRGMINGGDANEALIRYLPVTGAFRLMAAPYANGPVAWDTGNDAVFDIDMVMWLKGTQTSGSVPINVVAPAISGTAIVGQRLTADSIGTWSASSLTPTLNWQRDNQGNGNFSNIAGQTLGSYTVSTDDIGCKIRIVVVCTNDIGASAPSPSNQLGPVVSATVTPGSTGRTVFGGRSVTATRSTVSTRRAFEGGGG